VEGRKNSGTGWRVASFAFRGSVCRYRSGRHDRLNERVDAQAAAVPAPAASGWPAICLARFRAPAGAAAPCVRSSGTRAASPSSLGVVRRHLDGDPMVQNAATQRRHCSPPCRDRWQGRRPKRAELRPGERLLGLLHCRPAPKSAPRSTIPRAESLHRRRPSGSAREVQAVDKLVIDGSVAPVRLERGAVVIEKSRLQRVAVPTFVRGGRSKPRHAMRWRDPQPAGCMSCASQLIDHRPPALAHHIRSWLRNGLGARL
jgi:hypothetical protein